jgi:hypothetical protein
MANWTFNSNDYTAREFAPIPEGDHRVRINKVVEKLFNNGNEGFEITFDVNGHNSKLWYYLVLDPSERQKTNQRIGMFFDSFGIKDYDLSHFDGWVGNDGAVRVRHSSYNGSIRAQVAFCLNRKQQDRLPKWQTDSGTSNGTFDFGNIVQPAARVENPTRVFDSFKF